MCPMAIKAKKPARKLKKKKTNNQARKPTGNIYDFTQYRPSFFSLVPPSKLSPYVYNAIQPLDSISSIESYKAYLRKEHFTNYRARTAQLAWIKKRACPYKSSVLKAIYMVLKCRFILRRFLHHWRASRMNIMNSEDIFTGESIKNPVYITDTRGRNSFIFEATTLHRDITERLLNHDGFFSEPQPPRNPYTNKPFTLAQEISIWIQISRAKIPVSWAFTAFRASRWNIEKYETEYAMPLQLNSSRKTLSNVNSDYGRERLFDFIRHSYISEDIIFNSVIFSFIIKNHPNNIYVKKWRSLCIKYDDLEIIYANDIVKRTVQQGLVLDDTVDLIDDLKIKYTFKYFWDHNLSE